MAWVEADEGSRVPTHRHAQAQITVIVTGRVLVTTPTGEHTLAAGQAIHIPADTPHSAVVAENTIYVDIFHPARRDLRTKPSPDAEGNWQT